MRGRVDCSQSASFSRPPDHGLGRSRQELIPCQIKPTAGQRPSAEVPPVPRPHAVDHLSGGSAAERGPALQRGTDRGPRRSPSRRRYRVARRPAEGMPERVVRSVAGGVPQAGVDSPAERCSIAGREADKSSRGERAAAGTGTLAARHADHSASHSRKALLEMTMTTQPGGQPRRLRAAIIGFGLDGQDSHNDSAPAKSACWWEARPRPTPRCWKPCSGSNRSWTGAAGRWRLEPDRAGRHRLADRFARAHEIAVRLSDGHSNARGRRSRSSRPRNSPSSRRPWNRERSIGDPFRRSARSPTHSHANGGRAPARSRPPSAFSHRLSASLASLPRRPQKNRAGPLRLIRRTEESAVALAKS